MLNFNKKKYVSFDNLKSFNGLLQSSLKEKLDGYKSETDTKVQKKFNELSGKVQTDSEVIDARKGEASLRAKIDVIDEDIKNVNSQLARKAYKTYVTPYEFGAVKNTDSTQSFIDMINYANENKLSIMIPKHNFIISTTLPLFNNLTIYGDNGINSKDESCHIKYIGSGYLFENNKTMINIEFKDLVILGGDKEDYNNSCMKISCQRFKLSNCSIMYFRKCLVLNVIDQNVVENIIQNNLIQFCDVGIYVPQNSSEFLYSDSIIHNNFIATYKTVGISGYLAQFKITNNQIYTGHLTAEADILFGGFANYINNNNFGGKTINLMYDNVLYKGNLDENIITNNIFLNSPKQNNDLYCIVIKTDTIAKLLISNNIFGCERFDGNTTGKIYAIYCKGSGYQTSQIINNQGYLYKHIGGDENSRVNDLYIIGYDYESGGFRIGSNNVTEKLIIGRRFELASYGGTPPVENDGNVGKIISDVNNGNLYISRGQYGMQRCITTASTGNMSNIDMTSVNKIRYTTNVSAQYQVGDIIINPTNGDIYISKGSYGNKKLLLES